MYIVCSKQKNAEKGKPVGVSNYNTGNVPGVVPFEEVDKAVAHAKEQALKYPKYEFIIFSALAGYETTDPPIKINEYR
jgi:hypothetical protein